MTMLNTLLMVLIPVGFAIAIGYLLHGVFMIVGGVVLSGVVVVILGVFLASGNYQRYKEERSHSLRVWLTGSR